MKTISVHQFCVHYNIPQSFIDSLTNFELIEILYIETTPHIPIKEISNIERLMRIHYDLKVNFEGLDVINNMTSKIHTLQNEITLLKNKLDFYE